MGLDSIQKASRLFKKSMGKAETIIGRDFFEEPKNGYDAILPSQIWAQADKIPAIAPTLTNGSTQGVVQYFDKVPLIHVDGSTGKSFYNDLLIDTIPFTFGSGGSYNYALYTNGGTKIPFGQGDWIVDTSAGVLTFYGTIATVTEALPPMISFYKYIGTKGIASGATGLNILDPVLVATSDTDILTSYDILTDTYSMLTEIDGVTTFVDGDRVLIKNQTDTRQNGIFIVTSGQLVRSTTPSSVNDYVFVLSGTKNAYTGWVITGTDSDSNTIELGVNTQEWTFFSASNSYTTDGLGVKLTGNQFQLSLDETTDVVNGSGLVQTINGVKVSETIFNNITTLSGVTTDIQDFLNNLSGFGVLETTYIELLFMKNSNTLVIGQEYLISDYQTKHLIPYTNIINVGNVEPIIVTANSTNTLLKEAKSTIYPNDTIYYDIDDSTCEDGTWSDISQYYINGTTRNGKITFRHDIKNNLSAYCDWRAERYRRWAIDADEFRSDLGGEAGSINTTFITTGANAEVNFVKYLSNGNIMLGGAFTTYNGVACGGIVVVTPSGVIDSIFNAGAGFIGVPLTATELVNGDILIGGNFTNYNGNTVSNMIKIRSNGDFITWQFSVNGTVRLIVERSNGTILIGGDFSMVNSTTVNSITAINVDGTTDTTTNFGNGFLNGVNPTVINSIVVDSYNSILIGGEFTTYNDVVVNTNLIKLNSNGTIDATFNGGNFNGSVVSIHVYNNKYVIGGKFTMIDLIGASRLVQLNINGSIDSSFIYGSGFNNNVSCIKYDSINEMYIFGGEFTTYNGSECHGIARISLTGVLDTTFNSGVGLSYANSLDYSNATGIIILGGNFTTYNNIPANNIIAINSVEFISATYLKDMIVKVNTEYYIAVSDTVLSSESPSTNNADWAYVGSSSRFRYWYAEPVAYNKFNVNTSDYKDFYLFTIINEMSNSSGVVSSNDFVSRGTGFKNIEFGKVIYNAISNRNLFNNVLFITLDGFSERNIGNVKFGLNATDNTINANGFIENNIGNYFYANFINGNFNHNDLNEKFNNNVIMNSFYGNSTGMLFLGNVIINEFTHNTTSYRFINNTFSYITNKNIFGSDFEVNTTRHANSDSNGHNFSFNVFGNDVTNNSFGYDFMNNTIGSTINHNTFGILISRNNINGNMTYNTIGDNFTNNNIMSDYITSTSFANDFKFNSIAAIISDSIIGGLIGYNVNDPIISLDLTLYSELYFNISSDINNSSNVTISQNVSLGTGVDKLTVQRFSNYNEIEFFNFTLNTWEALSAGGFTAETAGSGLTYNVVDEKLNVVVDDYTVKIINNELRSSMIYYEAPDTATTIAMGTSGQTYITLTHDPITPVIISVNGVEYLVSPSTTSNVNMPFFYSQYPPIQGTVICYDSTVIGFGLESGIDYIVAKYNYIDISI